MTVKERRKKTPRRIDLGTVSEFELYLLIFPGLDPDAYEEHAHIVLPVSVATRVALRLMDTWSFEMAIQARLLGVTPRIWTRYRRGHAPTRDAQIDRIEDLLNIHKVLNIVFMRPTDQRLWVNEFNLDFGDRTPGEVMWQDGTRTVRQYLEARAFT